MQVLLVDDNPLFLEGLRNLLEDSGIQVLGTAANATEALEQAQRLRPDVVLMDVQMPGQSGIEATRALKSLHPAMKIVMMTVSENDQYLFDAISAGASGYLLKGVSPESFVAALEGLARGETPLSPGLAAKIMAEFARRDRQRQAGKHGDGPDSHDDGDPPLSGKQREILRQVAEGRPYKEIARLMGLTESTIKYHMGEIADRLHLGNRAQVIAYASRLTPQFKAG
jgi:two-component system NarL family response regulator